MKLRAYIAALHAALFAILLAVSPAGSGSMTLLGAGAPAAGGGGGGFALTFGASASSGAGTTLIDYGTMNYGSGNTRVIAVIQWYGNGVAPTISGVTIGGVALAQVSGAYVNNVTNAIDVWESTGSLAGTSGDVQVTYALAPTYTSTVALYNLQTTTPAASAHASNTGTSVSSLAAAISVPAGGGGIAAAFGNLGATISWTNAASDADTTLGGTHMNFGHTTSTGSITVTATLGGSDSPLMAVVAWGP